MSHTLRELLKDAFILRDGEGTVDLNDTDVVHVGIAFDVHGHGPHDAAIFVDQNRFHASEDSVIQAAHEILTEWMMEHQQDYLKELEEEYGDDALDVFIENTNARAWSFKSAEKAAEQLGGTPAEEFISIVEPDQE